MLYDIHYKGQIYSNNHKAILPTYEKEGNLYVKLIYKGKETEYMVASLILMQFATSYIIGMPITFKDGNKLNCNLFNLKYNSRKLKDLYLIGNETEADFKMWKCSQKADTANSRAKCGGIIDKHDILSTLKICRFKCFYCREQLDPSTWELDHFIPFFRDGKNCPSNIVCSCKICNRIKGELSYQQLIEKCYNIIEIFEDNKQISNI